MEEIINELVPTDAEVCFEKMTNVTVPTYAEIKGEKSLLTDYATANGAECHRSFYDHGLIRQIGSTWVREVAECEADSQNDLGVNTYTYLETGEGHSLTGGDRPDRKYIAVMPRFQNPEALGIDTAIIHRQSLATTYTELLGKESFLTINGILVLYPQIHTNPSVASSLREALNKGTGTIREVGSFRTMTQNNKCYLYNGKHYVHLENAQKFDYEQSVFTNGREFLNNGNYWFTCEPVRAKKCADGSIQCLDMLLTCPFASQEQFNAHNLTVGQELNTDDFNIGKFLNYEFIDDLQRSTRLSKIRVVPKLQIARNELVTMEKLSQLNGLPQASLRRNRLNGRPLIEQ